jgi:hypothetical protein
MRTVTIPIADSSALIQVLRAIVEVTGSHAAAAAVLGIQRPYVTRMLRGRVGKAIGKDVYKRMWAPFRRDVGLLWGHPSYGATINAFHRAIQSPEAEARVNSYRTWLAREIKKLGHVRGFHRKLRKSRVYNSYFTTFASRMEKRGFALDDPRLLLAELRALEPLFDWQGSGGIELSGDELRAEDRLRAYLDAALKRETILLERPPLPDRAFRLSAVRRNGAR